MLWFKWLLICLFAFISTGVLLVRFSTQPFENHEVHQPVAAEHNLAELKASLRDIASSSRINSSRISTQLSQYHKIQQFVVEEHDLAEFNLKALPDEKGSIPQGNPISLSTQPLQLHEIQQPIAAADDFAEFKALLGKKASTARRNLIIVSHGRSGSTLTGDIFNHHPSVFYMYEPLQTAIRIRDKRNLDEKSYNSLAEEFLTAVFRCNFDKPEILDDIERYYRKPDHPRISRAIGSPPLCPYEMTHPKWSPRRCMRMTSKVLGSACMKHYNLTVLKILIWRIPDNSIKTILTACGPPDVDCEVIFLVRDPRAMVPSSRRTGFFREVIGPRSAHLGTRRYSQEKCEQTEEILEFVRKLPDPLRDRIKLLRYEDLAINPLKTLADIYEFAGLPVLESVRTWLNETTHSSRNACKQRWDGGPVTCTKDNAWVGANRWRWMTQRVEIDIIEQNCRRVMNLMGYIPVNMSSDLLANKKFPLFKDDYEAKHWFLH
ncbi:carbohydrate sulfotransferase 4-like [Oculina patagonica]